MSEHEASNQIVEAERKELEKLRKKREAIQAAILHEENLLNRKKKQPPKPEEQVIPKKEPTDGKGWKIASFFLIILVLVSNAAWFGVWQDTKRELGARLAFMMKKSGKEEPVSASSSSFPQNEKPFAPTQSSQPQTLSSSGLKSGNQPTLHILGKEIHFGITSEEIQNVISGLKLSQLERYCHGESGDLCFEFASNRLLAINISCFGEGCYGERSDYNLVRPEIVKQCAKVKEVKNQLGEMQTTFTLYSKDSLLGRDSQSVSGSGDPDFSFHVANLSFLKEVWQQNPDFLSEFRIEQKK